MVLDLEKHTRASLDLLAHFALSPAGPDGTFLTELMDRYTTIPYENVSKIVRRKIASTPEKRCIPRNRIR